MSVALLPHPSRQESATSFTGNIAAWRALRNYMGVVAPEMHGRICVPWREPSGFFDDEREIPDTYEPENDESRLSSWGMNDGLGLNIDDCKTLAEAITADLDHGRTALRFNDDSEGKWMVAYITEFRDFLQKCGGFRIF
ncbi:hypothetical protein [Candidatus Poriferisodalis sp.]|uniref:hypothetical protein n=1 Tax=Candidatus Poriferisodalis sp. TaxID=3101277 RepID=UPI003D14165A